MNRSRSIQIKAAFLILVFSMNTVIGFACALGLDMGFNTMDHDEEATETMHTHADGKKHVHHEGAAKDHHHKKSNDGEDNCCSKHATALSNIDKTVPQTVNVAHFFFLTAFVSAFYNIDSNSLSQSIPNIKYFVRSHHPPILDIRIAIQSFHI